MNESLSLADIAAVTKSNEGLGGIGGGYGWLIIILLFFMAFGGGFGGLFGGNSTTNLEEFQTQKDVLTSSCSTQKEVLQSRYDAALGMNNLQAQMAECCCNLKTAIHSEGEATRALITENTIQELRDRLGVANNALTVQTISNNVVSQLQPVPKPAYLTCSPYSSYPYGYYNGYNGTII